MFSDETVDEFLIDGYLITREGSDGAVTMSIVGPDGTPIPSTDLPAHIAERVSFYESDWSPSDDSRFDVVDGAACYDILSEMGPNSDLQVNEDTNTVIRVRDAETNGDGDLTARARQWDADELTPEQRDGLATGDLRLADIPGGTDIPACDD